MRNVFPACAALLALGLAPQVAPPTVDVVALRFYRGGQTLVDGFLRVPYDLLQPMGTGAQARAAYRVAVDVRDSSGNVLNKSAWAESVPTGLLGVAGASSVEHFAFAAAAGRYTVDITITDSASGRVAHRRADVTAYAGSPVVSDLLVSGSIRRGQAGDTTLGAGEIRKGGLFITGATTPVLTPQQSTLYYYVEVYPGVAGAVSTMERVLGSDGRQIIASAPAQTTVGAGGGVVTGGLNLTGLPPGDYHVALVATLPDTVVTREAAFRMAGFETARAVAEVSDEGESATDPFARLTEAQLDTLYAPLVHIMDADERGVYDDLSAEGKRNYLRTFWAKRDPTPGTAANEAEVQYYARIQEANRRYNEGGAAKIPGWRTDRGRIFIRYGEPDEVLRRPQAGPTPPYEVWKYTHGRERKFVFLDETRFGNYALIYTDERREPSRADWESLLGTEAVQDVTRF